MIAKLLFIISAFCYFLHNIKCMPNEGRKDILNSNFYSLIACSCESLESLNNCNENKNDNVNRFRREIKNPGLLEFNKIKNFLQLKSGKNNFLFENKSTCCNPINLKCELKDQNLKIVSVMISKTNGDSCKQLNASGLNKDFLSQLSNNLQNGIIKDETKIYKTVEIAAKICNGKNSCDLFLEKDFKEIFNDDDIKLQKKFFISYKCGSGDEKKIRNKRYFNYITRDKINRAARELLVASSVPLGVNAGLVRPFNTIFNPYFPFGYEIGQLGVQNNQFYDYLYDFYPFDYEYNDYFPFYYGYDDYYYYYY